MDRNKVIERYLNSLTTSLSRGTSKYWPASSSQIEPYFSETLAFEIYKKFNKLKGELTLEEIGELIPSPVILLSFLREEGIAGLKVVSKYKIHPISTQDITDYFYSIYKILKTRLDKDVFCEKGLYRHLKSNKIETLTNSEGWLTTEKSELKELISRLNVSLENYSWSLFYDIYRSSGFEIHGPYDVSEKFGKNAALLVRDGYNLDPGEVWKKEFTPKTLRIYEVYKNVDLKIDIVNRLYYSNSIKDKLKYFRVVQNGKVIDSIEDIKQIKKSIEKEAINQTNKINSMEPIEIIKKGMEICYYRMKPFFEYFNEDWKPPKKLYKKIEAKDLKYWNRSKDKKPDKKFYRKLFDPRNLFFGE